MKLPTFGEARKALLDCASTPLDRFIHHWEPQGKEAKLFRAMLSELLDWSRSSCSMTPSEIEEAIADLPRHQPATEEKINANYGTQENLIRSFWNPTTGLYENAEAVPQGE